MVSGGGRVVSPFMKPLTPTFQPLIGHYEPSAEQLADGRFLVVEDEKTSPFSLVSISAGGGCSSTPLMPPAQAGEPSWQLNDLVALRLDSAGYVYASTDNGNRSG